MQITKIIQLKSLLKSYGLSHLRNCVSCLGTMWREPWNSMLTVLVIGVALALPTGLMALLANAQTINAHWNNGIQITVFLTKNYSKHAQKTTVKTWPNDAKKGAPKTLPNDAKDAKDAKKASSKILPTDAKKATPKSVHNDAGKSFNKYASKHKIDHKNLLQKRKLELKQYKSITNVQYISPEEALNEFEKATGQDNLLQYLEQNPLPPTITIALQTQTSKVELEKIIAQIKTWPEVEKLQLDQTWLQRLSALLLLADRFVTLVTILLAMTVFIITCNTIRVDIEKKKRHIIITKLVGATNPFIRREFLYYGFWYGLLGSVVAWLIVTISILILQGPVMQVASLYQSNFSLVGLNMKSTMFLFILGIMLGISGAWLAVSRYLDQLSIE